MHSQISDNFETIFLKFQCCFQRDSAQDCILTIAETCKKATDQGKKYAPLLTDLSKAFDCLAHDLVIEKLHAYGLSMESFHLMERK